MVLKEKALVPMDAREFYAQIDEADDGLHELIESLGDICSATNNLKYIFEKITRGAANIKDEEKREKFSSVLSYLNDRLHELGEQCKDICADFSNLRYCDFSELVEEAEYIANKEKKKTAN